MMETVSSRHNEQVKWLRKFQERRFREAEGCFIVEGPHLVGEALAAGWKVELVAFVPGAAAKQRVAAVLEAARRLGIRLLPVTESVMDSLTTTVTPQGITALVRRPQGRFLQDTMADLAARPLVLILDGLQDPGNLGTILRTADAAAVDAIFLTKGTVDLYAPKTVRAAAGALFRVVTATVDAAQCVEALKARGLTILVADAHQGQPIFERDLRLPVALVIGNEGNGVAPALRAVADALVHIPMPGRAESLNAAVAGSLAIYEAVRQRLKAPCV